MSAEQISEITHLLQSFSEKLNPIWDSSKNLTSVYEIKFVCINPLLVVVINLELSIWWDPSGLDRR